MAVIVDRNRGRASRIAALAAPAPPRSDRCKRGCISEPICRQYRRGEIKTSPFAFPLRRDPVRERLFASPLPPSPRSQDTKEYDICARKKRLAEK